MNNIKLSIDEIKDFISDANEDALVLDNLDDAIIGVAHRNNMNTVIAYDKNKIIEMYVKDGMSDEEAEEFFWYNTHGSWMGDGTPIFVEIMRDTNKTSMKIISQ